MLSQHTHTHTHRSMCVCSCVCVHVCVCARARVRVYSFFCIYAVLSKDENCSVFCRRDVFVERDDVGVGVWAGDVDV